MHLIATEPPEGGRIAHGRWRLQSKSRLCCGIVKKCRNVISLSTGTVWIRECTRSRTVRGSDEHHARELRSALKIEMNHSGWPT